MQASKQRGKQVERCVCQGRLTNGGRIQTFIILQQFGLFLQLLELRHEPM